MPKRVLLIVLAALLFLQVFRPAKNVSSAAAGPGDFIVRYAPPLHVAQALRTACYDCHSDRTHYPWYAEVQPLGWWLAHHINEGKDALNLSAFGSYSPKQQARKLNQMSDQIANRAMPLPSYLWIHHEARLDDAQVAAISQWLDDLHDKVESGE